MTYIAFLEVVVCLKLVSLSLPRSFFPLILFLLLWLVYFICLFFPSISFPVIFYFSVGGTFQTGFCQSFHCWFWLRQCHSCCLSSVCQAAYPTNSTVSPYLLVFTCFLSVFLHIVKYNISAYFPICLSLSKDHLSPSVWFRTVIFFLSF